MCYLILAFTLWRQLLKSLPKQRPDLAQGNPGYSYAKTVRPIHLRGRDQYASPLAGVRHSVLCGASQTIANLAAFCVAVTFSFFVNARWTFKAQATTVRYVLYVIFMGAMAAGVGKLADRAHINPVITLVAFSAISLVFGFIYSRFIVFRVKK
jgi:hypothetical protein